MRWRRLLTVSFRHHVLYLPSLVLTMFVAVGDKTYIMFDSGIRGASDVVKALCLGAQFGE